jgi:hypothetical protein
MTGDTFAEHTYAERARLAVVDSAGEAEAVAPVKPPNLAYWDGQVGRALPTEPRVRVDRIGQSYRVTVRPLEAVFLFRDVRTSGELSADLTVSRGRHLFRTTITLSLVGREKIAKVAADLSGDDDAPAWRLAAFAAVEAVLEAEEAIGAPVDLRTSATALPTGGTEVLRPLMTVGSNGLVSPGDGGKSTTMRAACISIASGRAIIPGIEPVGPPRPVLYVAGEDPVAYWHSRSIEAICRGAGITRATIAEPIELYDAAGRPLHRIARAIAERAADFGAVVLDSQQALLPPADQAGGIRDRDGLFWNGVDQLGVPVMVIAHPNRSDARDWTKADGRIAGSEVNRDRVRMAWRMTWRDEPAVVGTSYRRYTLENVKNNHGPKAGPLSFGAAWTFGYDGDPGLLTFCPAEPIRERANLSPELTAALEQYQAGKRTPGQVADALGINYDTAKSRLRLLRERGLLDGSDDDA